MIVNEVTETNDKGYDEENNFLFLVPYYIREMLMNHGHNVHSWLGQGILTRKGLTYD